jgi:leader peptidase (prepilin peptidase)/N-methyltransferase
VGSLVGVLIWRLPAGRPVGWSRSACDACGRPLSPLELIPIASYLLLGGRCRGCGARIAPFHLWSELAALAIPATAALAGQSGAQLWLGCLLGWMLLAAAWIDVEHFWLPDILVLPLVPAGLLATLLLVPEAATSHAAGAAAGYLGFRALGWAYARVRGREGLGQGDAKLLAVAGAWLGLAALPAVVLTGAVGGLVWALGLRMQGQALTGATALPFGPPLALAIWLGWLVAPNAAYSP